jgi:two-component system KDP operon response regulator KdpE
VAAGVSDRQILVVDDDPPIRRTLGVLLGANGFDVCGVADGQAALECLAQENFDLVILDLVLPDLNGVEVCKRLRTWNRVPVLVISAIGEEAMKVDALHAGADDYVTKPFSAPELVARVHSNIRRQEWGGVEAPTLGAGGGSVMLDLRRRRVVRNGQAVDLTRLEYEIISVLAGNAGRVITHDRLERSVRSLGYRDASDTLRAYILDLRKKLEDVPSEPRVIVTEPGVGYRLMIDDVANFDG